MALISMAADFSFSLIQVVRCWICCRRKSRDGVYEKPTLSKKHPGLCSYGGFREERGNEFFDLKGSCVCNFLSVLMENYTFWRLARLGGELDNEIDRSVRMYICYFYSDLVRQRMFRISNDPWIEGMGN